MRIPRVRFTMRRQMVAVALIAAVIRGLLLWQQWQRASIYRSVARYHAQMEKSTIIAIIEGSNSANPDELRRLSRLWSAHHAALRHKYESAAARPWEPVPPDPPEPVSLSGTGRRVDLHFEP